jgi:soluble lytic murein transglycosylase-like protein
MSIDSVRARVAEVQARIAGLSAALPSPDPGRLDQGVSGIPADAGLTAPVSIDGKPAATLQPFNVALATQVGQMSVKPIAGGLPPQIENLITKYSAQNGLDPSVVRAVIRAESDGDPKVVSHKGARGLMQLMPEELKAYGVSDPFDPEQNIMGGTRQLAEKLKIFDGDLRLALAAYNAGTARVKQYGGVPPFPETQKYVSKIFGMLNR